MRWLILLLITIQLLFLSNSLNKLEETRKSIKRYDLELNNAEELKLSGWVTSSASYLK